MTTWLAQSTLAASTGWGQSTAKGSSSRSGTKKLRWLSLCPWRWWTSKTRARPVPVKLFLRLSKMSMMRSEVITDQGVIITIKRTLLTGHDLQFGKNNWICKFYWTSKDYANKKWNMYAGALGSIDLYLFLTRTVLPSLFCSEN